MTIPENISDRVTWAIEFAWNITVNKIVNEEINPTCFYFPLKTPPSSPNFGNFKFENVRYLVSG